LSKKSIAIVVIVIAVSVTALYIMWRRSRFLPLPPIPPAKDLLIVDNYEDNPSFLETDTDLWVKLHNDAREGDYWADRTHWSEVGLIAENGGYHADPEYGDAKIVGNPVLNGSRSAELTIYETPQGYISHLVSVARYIRNSSVVGDGIYEVGAWFYVPSGYNPFYVHIAMENHLNWQTGYLIHAGVNPEDSTFVVVARGNASTPFQMEVIATIDFQYDTWFKLWIVYNTRDLTEYTCGYTSTVENRTFDLDKALISGWEPVYNGSPGFNFYATGHNLPDRPEQKLYVDDFYVRVIEG